MAGVRAAAPAEGATIAPTVRKATESAGEEIALAENHGIFQRKRQSPTGDAAARASAQRLTAITATAPSRKPESVEVTTPRLYVGNLSFDATESDLFELFNGVGEVQNAEVVTYKHNQRSKGFAFVQMLTVDEAKRAVEELHDKEFLGRKLVVSGAKSSEHHSFSN